MYTIGFDLSALDTGFKEHAARGIGRYVSELKKYFDASTPEDLQILPFTHQTFLPSRALTAMIDRIPLGRRTLQQQILFPLKLGSRLTRNYDLIHFPAHMDAPSWCRKKYIVTVLDLVPLVLQDLYRAERPGFRFKVARWLECQAIKNASLVLAISENTAKDVNRILGVPLENIVVTPLGIDPEFFAAGLSDKEDDLRYSYDIPLGRDIILYLGGIDPRKNWRGMLKAFKEVLKYFNDKGETAPVLVMVGKIEGDRQYPKLLSLIDKLGLEDQVVLSGYVDDQDLLQLFSISSLFCFLSLYEGFGLPPLEAMAAGTPVLSSDRSCMPEVLGEAALLVDPDDSPAVVKGMLEILEDKNFANELRERGRKQAGLFPWSRTGETTTEAYQRMAGASK